MEIIGARVRSLRGYKDWSQEDLARESELQRPHISLIENNERTPGADSLIKLARALETSTDYLLGLTDIPAAAATPNHPALKDPRFQSLMTAWQTLAALEDPEPCDVIHDLAVYLATKHAAKEED